ncbi:hypothetical protein RHMOL_Rhmol05G0305100 [Rhododendron molle]|uniref:Uncharacterized protein n=1 Tax=Rhododendron molle TaxID=49168 RepID=A0ACC0NUM7_RHOML|nr:hypothetical protein RHMOL_Rhmol05G0305100 [Rhododendron molle]
MSICPYPPNRPSDPCSSHGRPTPLSSRGLHRSAPLPLPPPRRKSLSPLTVVSDPLAPLNQTPDENPFPPTLHLQPWSSRCVSLTLAPARALVLVCLHLSAKLLN